jgi:hypothetical protein
VIASPLSALRLALLEDPDVAELLGDRVYVERLPGAEAEAMPRAGVVLRHAGGAGAPAHARLVLLRVDVHAFGPTTYTAETAHWTVHAALRRLERRTVGGTLLHAVLPTSGARAQTDPTTEWPELVSTWALTAAEEVAVA